MGTPIRSSLRHNRARRPEVGFFYGKSAAVPADDNKRNDHADRLGKSGSKGGAGRPQMQGAHKEIIQSDIGDTGNGNKIHGAFAVAQPAENGADDIIGRDKRDADKTDGQIFYGSRYRSLRRGHYSYNGPDKNKKRHSKHHRQAHKQCGQYFRYRKRLFFCRRRPQPARWKPWIPMASPTIMTVSICITWEPMDTAVVLATPSNWPMINRSAIP